jgi:hypothetical protein
LAVPFGAFITVLPMILLLLEPRPTPVINIVFPMKSSMTFVFVGITEQGSPFALSGSKVHVMMLGGFTMSLCGIVVATQPGGLVEGSRVNTIRALRGVAACP